MLISDKLQAAINDQIAHEFGASIQYIQIAAYFDGEDLDKFSKLFFEQAEEEKDHAMKFVHYILEAGGQVEIPAFPKSIPTFSSAEEAVQAAIDWEITVTKQINALMKIAVDENDFIGQDFLRWFVTEQLEEISKMTSILGVIEKSVGHLLLAEQVVMDNMAAKSEPAA